jgi:hypothetical protein
LPRKHQPSPTAATSSPATAGPTTRAPLNIEELSAMALTRSSRPTISTTNDCRAGMSNALVTPSSAAITKRCQTSTTPVSVRAASAAASSIAVVCVKTMMRWRLCRSATAPPTDASRKTGICPEKLTKPSSTADPVRR